MIVQKTSCLLGIWTKICPVVPQVTFEPTLRLHRPREAEGSRECFVPRVGKVNPLEEALNYMKATYLEDHPN